MREILNLPIPKVHHYCLDPRNPVGAEYIIEEKARGRPLGSLWHQWTTTSRLKLIAQLVDLEANISSILFQKHGCIYYKSDLETKGHVTQDLEAGLILPNGALEELKPSSTEKFTIGPLTDAWLWEGERAVMPLDRGPCKSNH